MMRKISLLIVLALVTLARVPSASAISIGFSYSPSWSGGVPGSTDYRADVIISGIPANDMVSAFDLNIHFDKSLLSGSSVTVPTDYLGGPLATSGSLIDAGNGLINIWALSMITTNTELQTTQSPYLTNGSLTLATLFFTAAPGTVAPYLSFSWDPGKDVKGMTMFEGTPNAYAEVLLDGSNATPVPEPSTLLLLGGAVSSLVFRRRKSSRPGP